MTKFIIAIRYFLGLFLIFTGIVKLLNFNSFINNVRAYNFIPDNMIIYLSSMLIFIEILIGFLFYFKFYQEVSAIAATILFSFFFSINIYARFNDLNLDCGCFAYVKSNIADIKHTIINIILLALTLIVSMYNEKIT